MSEFYVLIDMEAHFHVIFRAESFGLLEIFIWCLEIA